MLTPIECENNNIFRLELRRGIVAQVIHRVLECLPWLNSWAGWLPPLWLLSSIVIFKGVKPHWEQEFQDARNVYEQLRHRHGGTLAICFGIAAYYEDGSDVRTVGVLLTYCGTSLDER